MVHTRLGWSLLPLVVTPLSISGQEPLRTWTLGERRGRAMHLVGDSDGDGFPEFLIGDHTFRAGFRLDAAGRAFVVQSKDGSVSLEVIGTVQNQSLGSGLGCVGDIDGDGGEDFGISSHLSPTASVSLLQIHSGRDKQLLFERGHAGRGLASLGDLDGDGKHEFLIGDATHGVVELLRGGTLAVEREWSSTGGALGYSVAVLSDVDGDGKPDFAAGAPGRGVPVGTWPGKVQAFSTGDSALLFEEEGEGVVAQYGSVVVSPGDLTGDGVDDLVVAAPGCCSQIADFEGPGRLYFYDVKNDVLLATLDPAMGERGLGFHVTRAGDIDGNGVGDVFAFIQRSSNLFIDVVEGASRTQIARYTGVTAGFGEGRDWNGDTIPDLTVLTTGFPGREVHVYSGAPGGVRVLGSPCDAEPEPRIGCTGSARVGGELPVHVSGVAPGRLAVLALGTLDRVQRPGACRPRLRTLQTLWRRTTAVSPGKGAATVRLCVPNDAALQGRRFHAQWILPGAQRVTTRVLEVEVLAP
jgi:hypothetical protein